MKLGVVTNPWFNPDKVTMVRTDSGTLSLFRSSTTRIELVPRSRIKKSVGPIAAIDLGRCRVTLGNNNTPTQKPDAIAASAKGARNWHTADIVSRNQNDDSQGNCIFQLQVTSITVATFERWTILPNQVTETDDFDRGFRIEKIFRLSSSKSKMRLTSQVKKSWGGPNRRWREFKISTVSSFEYKNVE